MEDDKIENKSEEQLFELVIEYFVKYGSPIWSKFLFSLDDISMAPSTIRKYLNILEKKWLVYQPYNSAWRLPTSKWINLYVANLLTNQTDTDIVEVNQWHNLRWFVDMLWNVVDGVAFWHYEKKNDIHYLGVSKMLKKANNDIEKIIPLMEFIEKKELISYLEKLEIPWWKINYNFIQYQWVNIAMMYIKTIFEWQSAIIWILWSLRVDYKININILQKILDTWKI